MAKQEEIAQLTGFSRQTVSLAINHPHKLDPSTLARIQEGIEKLGYIPNQAARNFQKGRSKILGIVFRIFSPQDFSNPFLFQTLKGVHTAANEAGYGLRFQPFEETIDLEALFRSKAFDGLIYMTYRHSTDREIFEKLQSQQFPCVVFAKGESFPCVDLDYRQGIALALQKLLDRGRRQIVYIGGGLDQDFNQEKFSGFQSFLSAAGVIVAESHIFHDCWQIQDGERAARTLLRQKTPFDGVLVADGDLAAVGFVNELKRAGVRIPEEVSIISGDGSLYCQTCDPVLSSLSAPYTERARRAVEMLVAVLENKPHQPSEVIPLSFSEGQSL